ncbi:YiaA/YiaB family inner membrane protein [Neptunomonas sp.]|uniref:YiaA/YiaB family inner membrane protein n=1 Tax=Neptunomonas sp. TaxID=1971898 RepID=UPI0025DE6B65|nr:YiaA/YiaB family inner membrane protein [Neptunomonas sp.]
MKDHEIQSISDGWLFYVKASFAIAIVAVVAGIVLVPGSFLIKGYFALSSLFLISSTITLSKTMRDQHEAKRLINKVSEARTTKMINEMT